MKSKTFHKIGAFGLLGGLTAWMLAGCSGSFHNNFINGDSGVFLSAEQPMGNGTAHDFVELTNGIPVRLGVEFTPQALTGLPNLPHDDTSNASRVFVAPLPSKTHGTPLKSTIVFYSSGHDVPNVSQTEPAHLHATFLIRPFQDTVPPFFAETTAVAANEVPQDHVRVASFFQPGGILVPGIGVLYDDPREPANLPPLQTLGQSYLFFGGHMNAITLGPTLDALKSKQTLTQAIKQPEFYPVDGFYPTKWTVRFDATRNVHVIELTNFRRAAHFVPLEQIN